MALWGLYHDVRRGGQKVPSKADWKLAARLMAVR